MIWITIAQFIVWIVVSAILFFLFSTGITYIIEFKEHRIAGWLISQFMGTIYLLFGTIFTIWILTWMFFSELYLMLLLMNLTGILILAAMLWRIGVLNNKGFSRLHLKELLTREEHPNLQFLSNHFIALIGFISIAIVFYILFIMNVSLEIKAKYIIVASYLLGSASLMTDLFVKTSILSSPGIDNELRMDFLAASFHSIYFFSFFIYFILWILNIPLSVKILVIGGFNIYLLLLIVLGIFALFTFLVVLPYSIGENRVKNEEIKYLEKRLELIKEIEKAVDLRDLEKSKVDLNAENEKILKESTSINEEILNKQQYFKNLGYASPELTECLEDFFKPEISFMDSLRRYSEHITFTLKSEISSAYVDLDKITDSWGNSINEELVKVKKRHPLFWETISVASIIWASLSTFLGISLTDILKTLT